MEMQQFLRMFSWEARCELAQVNDWGVPNDPVFRLGTFRGTTRCPLACLYLVDGVDAQSRSDPRFASGFDANTVAEHFGKPKQWRQFAKAISEFVCAWDQGDISVEQMHKLIGTAYGLTLDEAKGLRQGQYLNCWRLDGKGECLNADGTPMRFKVTSVKTWKRTPERVEIRVQRGLYEHYTFDQSELDRLRVGQGY